MVRKVTIGEFENDVEGVLALVEAGSEIVVTRDGRDILRIAPVDCEDAVTTAAVARPSTNTGGL